MKKVALHWQILIGMAVGIAFGGIAVMLDSNLILAGNEIEKVAKESDIPANTAGIFFVEDQKNYVQVIEGKDSNQNSTFITSVYQSTFSRLVTNWIKPFGTIFVNFLKLIAIPLIVASLIKGVSDLQDISKLSRMGFRTLAIYITTTVLAVTLGLLIVNVVRPGKSISAETQARLVGEFQTEADKKIVDASTQKEKGPLQPLADIVPNNIFNAATSNRNMLQVIFFAIMFGVGLILIQPSKAKPVKDFFDSLNEVILKLIDLIMLVAPIGVFALMASIIVTAPSWDLLIALAAYSGCVIGGLAILIFAVYPVIVRVFTGRRYRFFMEGIAPAQLLAFSTSSSAATLPVTMERVEEHLGVDEEVTSFVLPIGATVNMDGTSLYQAVAAVFIAHATGHDLSLAQQLTIVLTATLASIGSAAVPGAGMVMLVIVLGAIGIPEQGLALIFAVDRLLDMCRTTVNVTGDATVSMLVAKSVGKLGEPKVKEWDDYYHHKDEDKEPETVESS